MIWLKAMSYPFNINSCPGLLHWTAVKHVFRYIAGTLDYRLTYGPSPHPTHFLTCSDADYAGCFDTAKSTSGYVLLMGVKQSHGHLSFKLMLLGLPLSQSMLLGNLPVGKWLSSIIYWQIWVIRCHNLILLPWTMSLP